MRDTIYIWLSILVSIDRLSFVFLAQAKHIKSRKERDEERPRYVTVNLQFMFIINVSGKHVDSRNWLFLHNVDNTVNPW